MFSAARAHRAHIRGTDRGLTLIELITTIAVIALVAAVAVPVFTNVLAATQDAAAANKKQIVDTFAHDWTNGDYQVSDGTGVYQGATIAFEDVNDDGMYDADTETVVAKIPGSLNAATAPTALVGAPTSGTSANVSWTAPGYAGSFPVHHYTIQYSTSASFTTGTTTIATTSDAPHATLTALDAGRTYHVRVGATNKANKTGAYSTSIILTIPTLPGTPTGLSLAAPTATTVAATWTAPTEDGGSAITGYRLQIATNPAFTAGTSIIDTATTATTTTFTALNAGSTYYVRVAARNLLGAGAYAPSAFISTATAPSAPTGLALAVASATSLTASWTAPASDGGAAVSSYRVTYSTSADFATGTNVIDTGVPTAFRTLTGLTAGTTYYVKVAATNLVSTGTATAAASLALTATASAPTDLAVGSATATTLTATWTAPASTGGSAITGYRVTYSTSAAFASANTVIDTGSTATTYTLTGLDAATTYYVKVAATNGVGTGTASAAASLATAARQVTTFAGAGNFADATGTAATFNGPAAAAVDTSGNVYVADTANHLIRKSTAAGVVTTLAGSGTAGFANGTGTAASFDTPTGVAVDTSGNVYVADMNNARIRKITSAGVVTTYAGSGSYGSANGAAATASFWSPSDVAVDSAGTVYVADTFDNKIRKITAAGSVFTMAGSGASGSTNGTGTAATFSSPMGLTVTAGGTVYVADTGNNLIRRVSGAGVVTTFAGSGAYDAINGTGTAAAFNGPQGIAVDTSANLYVADTGNNLIRKITSAGVVTTLAGSGTSGTANGTGAAASFNAPTGIAVISTGATVYVADTASNLIRKVTSAGVVTTLAGAGVSANGTGAAATFNGPSSVAVDATGTVYVADTASNLIRKITAAGVTTTLAGSGAAGSANGTGTAATFTNPYGLTVTAGGTVYVADSGNHLIRKITSAGVVTTVAGSGTAGSTNGTGTAASFSGPMGVAIDSSGVVYVADTGNNKIRKITSAGVVTTFAGSGAYSSANGTGTAASFSGPRGVAVDAAGTVYVADTYSYKIRKITTAGVVTTLAGSGSYGSANGTGAAATFSGPSALAVDGSGVVYVADRDNHVIRAITATGVVSTYAGTGIEGARDGDASNATFSRPSGVTVDSSGTVYVADTGSNKIRTIG